MNKKINDKLIKVSIILFFLGLFFLLLSIIYGECCIKYCIVFKIFVLLCAILMLVMVLCFCNSLLCDENKCFCLTEEIFQEYEFQVSDEIISVSKKLKKIPIGYFKKCENLKWLIFLDPTNWYYTTNYEDWKNENNGSSIDLSNPTDNFELIKNKYLYKK